MFIERIDRILKRYPLSLIVLATIIYLSFFKPPRTSLNDIENIDKLAHTLMYGGFCCVLWFEYYLSHLRTKVKSVFWGAVIAPLLFSGAIEILQELTTKHRGGDWWDFVFNSVGVVGAAVVSIYITRPLMIKYKLRNKNAIR